MDKGVFITGASRSGTSMIAGLFGVHGLWFGPLKQATDENPKGFWESIYFPRGRRVDHREEWPAFCRRHGYTGGPWAVKTGPEAWPVLRPFAPIVVRCWRDKARILASRSRLGWESRAEIVDVAWRRMRAIDGHCIDVDADTIAAGDYRALRPAFAALGVAFDQNKADEWISPDLYSP